MTRKTALNKKDFNTETWRRFAIELEARREELRDQLEADNDHATTMKLRGRVAELKNLLALAKAPADAPRTGDRVGPSSVDTTTPQSSGSRFGDEGH